MVKGLPSSVKLALADVARVRRLVGTFVSTDGTRGVVDVGGGRVPADMSGYVPEVGESVWVLFVGATATILGSSRVKPSEGTVNSAPSANLVSVNTVAGDFVLPYAAGLTLSAGQQVKLGNWSGGGFVYAVKSTTPAPAPAPAPPPSSSGPTSHEQVFTAIDSGSYRSGDGWWTGQVWASDNNTGAWFYGSKIPDTIPDSASITSIQVYISATQIMYAGPNFGLHNLSRKPSGSMSLSSLVSIGITNGWVSLPASFAALRSTYRGIGVSHGGFSIFRSVAEDGLSGALRIRWTI